jgi:hypothetical protein
MLHRESRSRDPQLPKASIRGERYDSVEQHVIPPPEDMFNPIPEGPSPRDPLDQVRLEDHGIEDAAIRGKVGAGYLAGSPEMLLVPEQLGIEEHRVGEFRRHLGEPEDHQLPELVEIADLAHAGGQLGAIRPAFGKPLDPMGKHLSRLISSAQEVRLPGSGNLSMAVLHP